MGNAKDIHIVGAVGHTPDQSREIAARLYRSAKIDLSHGEEFTGKPVTEIHANESFVLKANRNLVFATRQAAQAWCRQRLESERRYGVYHPSRTWLMLRHTHDRWQVANLSSRLVPLHTLRWNAERAAELWPRILKTYIRFAMQFEQRLDEGLSNFGLDSEGQLFYLDDDIFAWDGYLSFIAMISRWLRAYSGDWLNADLAAGLGQFIRETLIEYGSPFDIEVVAEALKDQYVGHRAESVKRGLLQALRPVVSKENEIRIDWNSPVGLLADIHANEPALRAVLAAMEERGVKQYLVLGDIVGYGPFPGACIEELRTRKAFCIRGNHDHFVGCRGQVKVAMSLSAKMSNEWTIEHLSKDQLEWLATLPVKMENENILAVHGSPADRTFFNGYVYEMTYERNLTLLAENRIRFCFHGHSHLQGTYALHGGKPLPFNDAPVQSLRDFDHVLINPGAVGQPRNGDASAQAAVFDPAHETVEFLRCPYPIEKTVRAMETAGFEKKLVQRLQNGR